MRLGIARVAKFDVCPVYLDCAGFCLIHARDYLDERGLAGAFFAQQRMHLTGAHVNLHVDKRLHAGRGLVTVRQPKQSFLLTGMRSERTEGRHNDGAFIHSRQDCQHPHRVRRH